MKTTSAISTALIAAAPLLLAACDATHSGDGVLDPMVAQHLVATRADPDAALAEKVKAALGIETGQGAYGVEATAEGGAVDLWGTVDSSAAHKRFVTTAAGVVGVRKLRDHIRVDPGA